MLLPTAPLAGRVERPQRVKDPKCAESTAGPARTADEPANFAQSLRDKRKGTEKTDRSDASPDRDSAETPVASVKPKATSKKADESRKSGKAESAESGPSTQVDDSKEPLPDELPPPGVAQSGEADRAEREPIAATPTVNVTIAQRPTPPLEQVSQASRMRE